MDSQEDSIDIVNLKRLALGLAEQSQSQAPLKANALPGHDQAGPHSLGPDLRDIQTSTSGITTQNHSKFIDTKANDPQFQQGNTNVTCPEVCSPRPEPLNFVSKSLLARMNSAGDGLGDTQPISQSIFDSIINRGQAAHADLGDGLDMDRVHGDRTVLTLTEDDTGHIDLLSGFGDTEACNDSNSQDEEGAVSKVGESSPSQYGPNLFPESQRFLDRTPAITKGQGDIANLAITPSLARNPLAPNAGSSGGIMALSQVFKSTQAPSSPFTSALPSDSISARPSPDIPIQNRPLSVTALPSPSRHAWSALRRGFTEPHPTYITMKESQANREKLAEQRRAQSAENINFNDQSDCEFESVPSFIQRLNRRRRIDEEANAQLANLSAPARRNTRKEEKIMPPIKLTSKFRKDPKGEFAIPTLEDETQASNIPLQSDATSEAETEQEDHPAASESPSRQPQLSTEENKENYSGPPIRAPDSTTIAHGRLSEALDIQSSPHRSTTPPNESTVISRHSTELESVSQPSGHSRPFQEVNVRDSQPSSSQGGKRAFNEEGKVTARLQEISTLKPSDFELVPSEDTSSDTGILYSSPPVKAVFSSPLPKAQHELRVDSAQLNNSTPRISRPSSVTSEDSEIGLPGSPSNKLASQSEYRYRRPRGMNPTGVDLSGTKESMPSRISDTPIHELPATISESVLETSIPEMSPDCRQNGAAEAMTTGCKPPIQEGDDLLPTYGSIQGDSVQPHGGNLESLTLRSSRAAKILSSPSGRQRRALTEIAADASPQVATGTVDIDINLLTADDREFGALVGLTSTQPKKKRRGNKGQKMIASDPVVPVTPQPESSSHILQNKFVSSDPHSKGTFREDALLYQGAKLSQRTDKVETNDLTQHAAAGVRSCQINGVTRQPRGAPQLKRPINTPTFQCVAIPNRRNSAATRTKNLESSKALQHSSTETPPVEVVAPNQVLAFWNGFKRACYPATCVGTFGDPSQLRYVIKFEDSAPVEIAAGLVKRLELRIGDPVKVEMPSVPKIIHIVRGFRDRLSSKELDGNSASESSLISDIYGHTTVVLAAKPSKGFSNGQNQERERTITVPISRIYLDMILWNQLKDRQFSYNSQDCHKVTGSQTPINGISTPPSPNSRASRSIINVGLFVGMVFAVSYVGQQDIKARVSKLILDNGGRILEDGFEELFDFASTTIIKPANEKQTISGERSLRLAHGAEKIGFACLIADKHSRRAKYMQALALNIPCLSGRWVEDSVDQNRTLDWGMYLLPAGESVYLHGAVKSRILAPNPVSSARFVDTIASRPKLLDGTSVLIVTGRGKAEEKRKAYIFLTYAMGASRVERVFDLKAAKAAFMEKSQEQGGHHSWDWLYVDDYEEAMAKTMLANSMTKFKKPSALVGKKRKRSMLMESISGSDLGISTNKVRIVGNEFVCQSLILGKICEESLFLKM